MNFNNKCKECGAEFDRWSSRSDKKYCDATCRKRYNRAKKEAEKQCRNIEQQLHSLRLTLKRKPHARTDKAISKMKWLRNELNDLLQDFDPATAREQFERGKMITDYQRKRGIS